MNYKRNRIYFIPKSKYNYIVLIIFLLLGITAMVLSFLKIPADYGLYGYILGGILILVGSIFAPIFKLTPIIHDEEIDFQIREEIERFRHQMVKDFEFTPVDEYYLPVHFLDNMIDSSNHRDVEIYQRKGDDNKIRSSQHQAIYYFFEKDKFLVFRYEFSLIQAWNSTSYKVYFYSEDQSLEAVENPSLSRIKEKKNYYNV